jgi:hypothetical protein
MGVFCFLHPTVEVDPPPFVDDFHLETKVTLNQEAFVFVLGFLPHLFFGGISSMVLELLRDCFILDDFSNGFNLFFEVSRHIDQSHVSPLVSCLFSHVDC